MLVSLCLNPFSRNDKRQELTDAGAAGAGAGVSTALFERQFPISRFSFLVASCIFFSALLID
jgi:hypothetical protein